ncbi:hypothetical protein Tco_0926161 [Tanacetum coccineum]|uniref:Reverse transcriptase domain-containing protein n=1 Tax=Tanacetum coccineum TaxID=301880 RepID=A0ABQ5D9V5_9ASTR
MDEYSQKWHNGTSRSRSTETSDGLAAIQAQLNNLGREIKKVNEKVYAAQVGCEQCKGPYYTKDCPFKEEGKTLKEAYYTQLVDLLKEGDIEQQPRDSIKGTMQILQIRASTDAAIRNQGASIKTLEIQIGQMSKVLQERGFGSIPSSIEENPRDQVKSISTTIEADSYSIAVLDLPNTPYLLDRTVHSSYFEASHINNSIPRKEKDPGSFTLPCFINNVCFDNALIDLGASVSVMPLSTYLNLGLGELAHTKLTVELADRTVKYPKGIAENVLVGIGKFVFPVDFIILDMPKDIKVPLILGRPFLSTARAKIDVYKIKITLRAREERIVFTSVKPASSLIRRVYMLSLRERMKLDLEARLMGETLVLNRLLDPFFEDYIKLNGLNEPFELRRNQGNDLMPTIEEGEVIEEFRTRDDGLDTKIDDYPTTQGEGTSEHDGRKGERSGDQAGIVKVAKEVVEEVKKVIRVVKVVVEGNVRTTNNGRGGCSYKEFMACNPKDYDRKGGAIVYTRWIKKMESVQDMSRCGENQKVKYTAGSFIGRSSVQTMRYKSWKLSFSVTPCSELAIPRIQIGSMSLLATEPITIQSAVQKAGMLTDEAIRNGALKKVTKKRGNSGELSRDGKAMDDNKKPKTRRVFSTITNPVRKEYTDAAPKCPNYSFHHNPRNLS